LRKITIFFLIFIFPAQIFAQNGLVLRAADPSAFQDAEAEAFPESADRFSFERLSSGRGPVMRVLTRRDTSPAGYSGRILANEARGGSPAYDTAGDPARINPAAVAARSLLLPGLGQRKMGNTNRSRIFFALEGAAWIGMGAFLWQSIARKNAYEDYATAFAGVDGTGYSDDYYETIGNFFSNDGPGGYNEYIMREARDLYYPDQEAIQAYYEDNIITGDDGWRWETEDAYERYNDLRKGSNAAERRMVYTLFYMLGLRVISAVDAVRSALGDGESPGQDKGQASGVRLDRNERGLYLTYTRSF